MAENAATSNFSSRRYCVRTLFDREEYTGMVQAHARLVIKKRIREHQRLRPQSNPIPSSRLEIQDATYQCTEKALVKRPPI